MQQAGDLLQIWLNNGFFEQKAPLDRAGLQR